MTLWMFWCFFLYADASFGTIHVIVFKKAEYVASGKVTVIPWHHPAVPQVIFAFGLLGLHSWIADRGLDALPALSRGTRSVDCIY